MSDFKYFGDPARLSDTEDGTILAADINNVRVSPTAWELAKRVYAAGSDGVRTMDVSPTDQGMLERAGTVFRTDPMETRIYLDTMPVASKFVVHVPPEPRKRVGQHDSFGVPL